MHHPQRRRRACAALLAAVAAAPAFATESNGGIYPNGIENYGVAASGPPGVYWLMYGSYYEATSLRDNSGNKQPFDFNVKATAVVPRVIWVTNQKLLGGKVMFHAIAPIVDLQVKAAGASDRDAGLGDITLGAALGYQPTPNLFYVFDIDVNAPTGRYSKDALANIGRNYWNVEPVFALSYVDPTGPNLDLKLMYDFNARNKDTDYKSGQELHADFAAGWGVGSGWTLGLGGYWYRQTTADRQYGATIANNKGSATALGPSIRYMGNHWLVTVKYEAEFDVRNRAQGNGLKIKALLPF